MIGILDLSVDLMHMVSWSRSARLWLEQRSNQGYIEERAQAFLKALLIGFHLQLNVHCVVHDRCVRRLVHFLEPLIHIIMFFLEKEYPIIM
jgi:hypothetical protein